MKTPLPPEFDAMAQRFVELWQEQWLHFANNKDTASAMQKLTELMVPPSNFNRFFQQGGENDHTAPFQQQARQAAAKATSAGAKAAATTLDAISQQLAELANRVDALSEQLDATANAKPEPRAAKPRKKPAAASTKPARASTGTGNKRKTK